MHSKILFPGKFHPPHVGHIKTILKLRKQYDLTICVTSDIPDNPVTTPEQIAGELAWFAPTILFDGTLTEQTENPFPGYTIASGNPDVIAWANRVGAEHVFIERSGHISGTQIRGRNS